MLIDGAPLTSGSVRFIPVGGGRPSVAEIGGDGQFDFGKEGVVVGKQRVEVIATEQIGATGYRWHAPEKYASYSTSGLEEDVSQPTSDLTLKLSWAAESHSPCKGRRRSRSEEPKSAEPLAIALVGCSLRTIFRLRLLMAYKLLLASIAACFCAAISSSYAANVSVDADQSGWSLNSGGNALRLRRIDGALYLTWLGSTDAKSKSWQAPLFRAVIDGHPVEPKTCASNRFVLKKRRIAPASSQP